MPITLPRFVQLTAISQSEFVPNGQSHLATLQLREAKPGNTLLIKTQIPANRYVCLGLRLFQTSVIVRLDLHQRTKYVLILIRIFVPQENRLRFVVNAWFL